MSEKDRIKLLERNDRDEHSGEAIKIDGYYIKFFERIRGAVYGSIYSAHGYSIRHRTCLEGIELSSEEARIFCLGYEQLISKPEQEHGPENDCHN